MANSIRPFSHAERLRSRDTDAHQRSALQPRVPVIIRCTLPRQSFAYGTQAQIYVRRSTRGCEGGVKRPVPSLGAGLSDSTNVSPEARLLSPPRQGGHHQEGASPAADRQPLGSSSCVRDPSCGPGRPWMGYVELRGHSGWVGSERVGESFGESDTTQFRQSRLLVLQVRVGYARDATFYLDFPPIHRNGVLETAIRGMP